jgi:hypothetical protein
MKKITAILLLITFLFSACQSKNAVVPTSTTAPTETPTETSTPISDEIKASVSDVYQLSLIINVDAILLQDIFTGVQSGEMSDMDAYNNVLSAITVVNAIEEQIPLVNAPDSIAQIWQEMIGYQETTKQLLAAWSNSEMELDQVVVEISAVSTNTSDAMARLENQLAGTYGMDLQSLRSVREETVAQMKAELLAKTIEEE